MKLQEYNKKRNFEDTSEPKGRKVLSKEGKKSLKFVIQYHQARTKHYDFRLSWQGVLLSWAVPKGLSFDSKEKRLAVMVEDHPLDYINFEGIIPKGNYGAGTVEIFDKGNYLPLEDMTKGLKKGHIKILLNGEKHKGIWSLVKIKDANWLIIKHEDTLFTKDVDKERLPQKLTTKKSSKNPFDTCKVQLATLSSEIPKGEDWIFEIKYDGYRIVAFLENKTVKLVTRNNQNYTNKFIKITESLKNLPCTSCVLDGEIVSLNKDGTSDFSLLQTNLKQGKNDFCYVIFDILALNGEDLRGKKLSERKQMLENLLKNCQNNLNLSSFVVNQGKESFALAKKMNLEGIVAKNINSKYKGKRNEDWLKIKCYKRQEFVIGGYITTEKNRLLSAILVGYYENGKLKYVGKVGTGFNEQIKLELNKKFATIQQKTCPFSDYTAKKDVFWMSPVLICEVQYAELTKDNLLRQPSFIGLREDKNPLEVTLEDESEK